MISVLLIVLVAALAIASYVLTRSMTRLVLTTSIIFLVSGAGVQTSVSLGHAWTVAGLQVLLVVDFLVLLALSVAFRGDRDKAGARWLRRDLLAVWLPALAIGGFLVVMRLLASPDPGPLAGVGYLAAHPAIEDSAKWSNLASQMVTGRELDFVGGYSGGPMLMVMGLMVTLLSALSFLLLGGVNEVAVVVGTVIGAGFLMITLVPFALAPLAQARLHLQGRASGSVRVPAPAIWAGIMVVAAASAVLSGLGHLSLQFVLLVLVLWFSVFLARGVIRHGRVLASLVAVGAGIIWFPLNVFSIVILVVVLAWLAREFVRGNRPWAVTAVAVLVLLTTWEGLFSSLFYALGIGSGTISLAAGTGAMGALRGASALIPQLLPMNITQLFSAPGGTEEPTAVLTALAGAGVLGAAAVSSRLRGSQRAAALALVPIAWSVFYLLAIAVADGVFTGTAPGYATLKMGFGFSIAIAGATLPVALMILDWPARGMTLLRWAGFGGVVGVLVLEGILPRAVSVVSPTKWLAEPLAGPEYWSAIEVQPVADQPVSSLPIACTFLPPGADKPSSMPRGELAYSCTRLLIGLSGKEAQVGSLMEWVSTDWLSNASLWNEWYPNLVNSPEDIKPRRVLLFDENGTVIGFETLQGLLNRFPPPAG